MKYICVFILNVSCLQFKYPFVYIVFMSSHFKKIVAHVFSVYFQVNLRVFDLKFKNVLTRTIRSE